MGRDVLLKFLHYEGVNDFGCIVGRALGKSIIELEAVAGNAVLRIGNGRHVGPRRVHGWRIKFLLNRSGSWLLYTESGDFI